MCTISTNKVLTVCYGDPGAVHGGVGQDTGAQLLPAPANSYYNSTLFIKTRITSFKYKKYNQYNSYFLHKLLFLNVVFWLSPVPDGLC